MEQENTQVGNTDNKITPETQEDKNWKVFRENREKERQEKILAEKRLSEKEAEANALKAAMETLLSKPQQQALSQDDDLTEDDRINKKVQEAMERKDREYEAHRRQKEAQEFPAQLKRAYGDFDSVCTTENCDYLEYHHPEVANALKYMPEGFEKWSGIYQAIKRYIPNNNSAKDKAKAEANAKKPQSMSTAGIAQTGDTAPHYLDDKRKADNWARMRKAMGKTV
jgi:hypothetical protein